MSGPPAVGTRFVVEFATACFDVDLNGPADVPVGTSIEYVGHTTRSYADGVISGDEFWGHLHEHRLAVLSGPLRGHTLSLVLHNDEPWPSWLRPREDERGATW